MDLLPTFTAPAGQIGFGDMALLLGRILISLMFFLSSSDKFRADAREIDMIKALHLPAPKTLEVLTGVFEVVAAACLLIGFFGRAASAALAIFVIFVSFAFLRFWTFLGPRDAQIGMRNVFFANLAVTGGLLGLTANGLGVMALNNF